LDPDHVHDGSARHLEVAVVGGGQAGLAIGYYVKQQRRHFAIFERAGALALGNVSEPTLFTIPLVSTRYAACRV
jgi:ribulose 1,5-bisphosphate synthetase/thiazole synthase